MTDSLSNHVDHLVHTAFEINPSTVYGWALASTVILVIAFSGVIIYLFRFFNAKMDSKESIFAEERTRHISRQNELEKQLLDAKLEAVAAIRDVLNALNVISVAQKDSTDDIINQIDKLKIELVSKMERING